MELRDYLKILRRSWIIITACVVGGAFIGMMASIFMTAQYESTSQHYVSVRNDQTASSELMQGSNFAQQAVLSYIEIATSAIVLEQVIEEVGLEDTVHSLAKRIDVTSPAGTVLINITVVDPNPNRAAEITNATGVALTQVVEEEIELAMDGTSGPVQITTTQPGQPNASPVSPRTALNMIIAAMLGLALGLGAAILRASMDSRFHTVKDLESILKTPVLGSIAHDPDIEKQPLIVHTNGLHPRAEAFRSLRTNLEFVATEAESRVFALTSSVPGEGKTTTAANLAIALAETGANVLLVDADLRKPSIANLMGIEGGAGLTDVLIDKAAFADVVQAWGRTELAVLPAGRIPPNPSELLGSNAMQHLVKNMGEQYDYVIIDTPPLLPVADAVVVSRVVAGAILVAAARSTRQPQINNATQALRASGINLLGVVANKLPVTAENRSAYTLYGQGKAGQDQPEQEDAQVIEASPVPVATVDESPQDIAELVAAVRSLMDLEQQGARTPAQAEDEKAFHNVDEVLNALRQEKSAE